jgi:tripartite-type tricarboxylate transporter receptor subunit TctC
LARRARKLKFALVGLTLWVAPPAIGADGYPTGPIRFLVGFPAGGPGDVGARFLAAKLGDALGKTVYVENKPGAAGMLGEAALLAQPRDGQTIVECTQYDAINTVLYKSVKFQLADLAPISLISKYYQVVAVPKTLPVDSTKELIAYAKAQPGKLNYGALGPGSTQELGARQLEKLAGIQMTGIMYKGAAPAMQELMAGRLDLFIGPSITVMPLYAAKEIKVLAVAAPARLANAPEVPTLIESGLPLISTGFLAVCAAAATPQPIIERLGREIRAIVATDSYRSFVENSGSIAESSTPDELRSLLEQTKADAGALIDEFKLQIDQ